MTSPKFKITHLPKNNEVLVKLSALEKSMVSKMVKGKKEENLVGDGLKFFTTPEALLMNKAEKADIVNAFSEVPLNGFPMKLEDIKLPAAWLETEDGRLTSFGSKIVREYASAWVHENQRALGLERDYPQFVDLFTDIRADPSLARSHAS